MTQPSPLTTGANVVSEDCGLKNGEIYVNAQGGVKPYKYSIGQGFGYNSIFKGLNAGSYLVSVLDNNDCLTEYNVQLLSNNGPTALAGDDKLMDCSITQLTITGSGSFGTHIEYEWTTADGHIISPIDQLEIDVDAPGTYVLQVLDNTTECITLDTMVVKDLQIQPELELISADTLTCLEDELWISIEEKQDVSFVWTTDDGEILTKNDSTSVQVNTSAWYYIEAEHDVSKCQILDSMWVEANQETPSFELVEKAKQNCPEETVELEATGLDIMKSHELEWSTASGRIVGVNNEAKVEVDLVGFYYLKVTDAKNGCIRHDTVEVTNNWNTATADYDLTKDHLKVEFTDESTGDNLIWAWDFG